MSRGPWRVLVADDDPTVALLTRAALPAGEFLPTVVDNGDDAWLALQGQPFDLALLDVEMPGLDGLAVAAAIRRMPGGDFPVVLVTGRHDPALIEQARELSADCITKPVDWAVLPGLLRGRLISLGD